MVCITPAGRWLQPGFPGYLPVRGTDDSGVPKGTISQYINRGRITYCPFCQGRDHVSKSRQRFVNIFSFIQNSSLGTSFADLQGRRESNEAAQHGKKCEGENSHSFTGGQLLDGEQKAKVNKNHFDETISHVPGWGFGFSCLSFSSQLGFSVMAEMP